MYIILAYGPLCLSCAEQTKVRVLLVATIPDYNTAAILLKSYRLSSLSNYWSFHFLHPICHVYKSCELADWNPKLFSTAHDWESGLYKLGDVSVSSNLIGSLSLANMQLFSEVEVSSGEVNVLAAHWYWGEMINRIGIHQASDIK